MARVPKGWMFTAGLSALAIVAALTATTVKRPTPPSDSDTYQVEADSCFRYGRLECCVKE